MDSGAFTLIPPKEVKPAGFRSQLVGKQSQNVCNLISIGIQPFCEGFKCGKLMLADTL